MFYCFSHCFINSYCLCSQTFKKACLVLSSRCFIHQPFQLPFVWWVGYNKTDYVSSSQMHLFFYIVTPYDVNITGSNTYPHGSQLQLHCLSEGGPQLEYSWSSPNSSYTTTNNLTISNVSTLDGGNYTCTVTNDAGSSSNSYYHCLW